ncbi:tetratricopeptide repeat protein [Hahella ganghwensis]|uniref:tetratricopeptide repeat protein n=1 Tax=Hahella ganghwensis TaxID=286420 RepID=UPI00037CD100|nr:hypothetical protein [Hahella ganghwensis]
MVLITERQGRKFSRLVVSGLVSLGLVAVLSGCQQQQTKPEEELNIPTQESEADLNKEPAYLPKAGLTSKQRFRYALKKLNANKVDEALVELEAYQSEKPNDSRATRIIKQIKTPVEELYPAESFPIQLKWGQTLSTLSRDYLGDVYGFYGLAKYNGIPVSSKLIVGQSINIPATDRAIKAKKQAAERAKAETEAVEEIVEPVPEDIADMEESAAVDMEDQAVGTNEEVVVQEDAVKEQVVDAAVDESVSESNAEVTETGTAKVEQLSGSSSAALINSDTVRQAIADEDYVAAAEAIHQLRSDNSLPEDLSSEVPSIYQRVANELESDDPALAARYHYEIGNILSSRGDLDAALPAYVRSVGLDESNEEAQRAAEELKAQLAAKYHRMATNAYRKQELDEAISLWEYVLDIDPEHSAAKAYLVQANELKGKLSKIKDQ